jgi:hypothetical protein
MDRLPENRGMQRTRDKVETTSYQVERVSKLDTYYDPQPSRKCGILVRNLEYEMIVKPVALGNSAAGTVEVAVIDQSTGSGYDLCRLSTHTED